MSMDRYRTFVVAARCKTFAEAADELYITPATVSKHIANLEKELGVMLFTRMQHGAILTEEGRKKLPLFQQLVKIYDSLTGETDPVEEVQSLTVMASPPPSRYDLEKIVRGWSHHQPDIKLNIQEIRGASSTIISGMGELAFLNGWHLDSHQLRWINIYRDELGIVMSAKHPLAGRKCIALQELKGERFIFPNPEIGVVSEYIQICRQQGFVPQMSCYAYRDDSVLFYASCGEGVAFFPKEMFRRFHYPDVAFVPLAEKRYVTGALARSRVHGLSPAASLFWNYVKKNFAIKPE